MKQSFLKYFMMVTMLTLVVGFSACGGDDDDESNPDGSGNTGAGVYKVEVNFSKVGGSSFTQIIFTPLNDDKEIKMKDSSGQTLSAYMITDDENAQAINYYEFQTSNTFITSDPVKVFDLTMGVALLPTSTESSRSVVVKVYKDDKLIFTENGEATLEKHFELNKSFK